MQDHSFFAILINMEQKSKGKIYFADFENTTDKINSERSDVYLWGLKSFDRQDFAYNIDLETFYDYIITNKINEVYFHNLSWDGNFIFKDLLEKDFNYYDELDAMPTTDNGIWWLMDESYTIYKLVVNFGKLWRVTFLCTYQLLRASIGKLGESMGLEKLNIDYDKFTIFKRKRDVPPMLVNYLERDIDIMISAFSKIKSIYETQMTIGATSLLDFKKHYGYKKFAQDFGGSYYNLATRKKETFEVLTKDEWLKVKEAYFGGFSQVNPTMVGKHFKNVDGYSYDKVSMYPSIMAKEKLPYGRLFEAKPEGSHAYFIKVFIHTATAKNVNQVPILRSSNIKFKKLEYVNFLEDTELDFYEVEWEFIKKHYHLEYDILDIYYFKTKEIYTSWINERFHLKANASNQTWRLIHKLVLNNAYGKYGQDFRRLKKVLRPIQNGQKISKATLTYKQGTHLLVDEMFEGDKLSYIPAAAAITAHARVELFKLIIPNSKIWIYSDTDSVHFLSKPQGVENIGLKLGDWEPEARFNAFKAVRAKAYLYSKTHLWKNGWVPLKKVEVKRVISGINKGKESINYRNFAVGLRVIGAKKMRKNVPGGLLLKTIDYVLRK